MIRVDKVVSKLEGGGVKLEQNKINQGWGNGKVVRRSVQKRRWKFKYRKLEKHIDSKIGGVIVGDIGIGNMTIGYRRMGAVRGHGFAAEYANTLSDRFHGRNVSIVGDSNVKNGADRLVNGQFIQTKYCMTGKNCINACFENNEFRYIDKATGKPMQIEVPYDEKIYNDAVKAMELRIEQGQVPGVKDPAEAKNIVKRGEYTYAQVRNIAKAGTIESLKFDIKTGAYVAAFAGGLSFVITFIIATNQGMSRKEALKMAALSGLNVGGVSFITSVIASQLSRNGIPVVMNEFGKYAAKQLGPKACADIANAFRVGAPNIYGAAARNNVGKMLANNAYVAVISTIVISAKDAADMFRGRISGKQLFKNICVNGAGVAGGMAGAAVVAPKAAAAGAAIGGSCFGPPGVVAGGAAGAVVGAIIGAVGGGMGAGKVCKVGLDILIEDDVVGLVGIIEKRFASLSEDYLINQAEADKIVKEIEGELNANKLKDMYASNDKQAFADNLLTHLFDDVTRARPPADLPNDVEIIEGIKACYDGFESN